MLGRHRLVDLDGGVQRARQWGGHHRHVIFFSHGADAKRQRVQALGAADRCGGLAALIAKRHGKVGRVHDPHRGGGHRRHHKLARTLMAPLAELSLDGGRLHSGDTLP